MEDPVRFGLALAMLLGATASDLRTRRVPNRYWLPWLAAALVLLAGDLLGAGGDGGPGLRAVLVGLLWALGTMAFLYGMWWFGLFGGADAKGLMVLALLWPRAPELVSGTATTPTIDALVDGTLAVIVLPVVFLLANLLRGHAAVPAMLLGLRMERERARRMHVWPMQRVTDDGALRWRFWQRIGAPLDDEYDRLRAAGVEHVWATPKVPFMLPLSLGLVAQAWWGNLLLGWMRGLVAP